MKVELLHADYLEYDEVATGPFKTLIGNVSFRHQNAIMNCDSAHFFSETNYIEAYSRVHIRQGDSLNLHGDLLKYYGDTRKAELYNNIRLMDRSMTLTTDRLDYDMNTDIGFYNTGGKIVDKGPDKVTKGKRGKKVVTPGEENTLTSRIGYYYAKQNELVFTRDVVLTNPDYVMNSDSLRYNTINKTAWFFGPSTVKGDDSFIYCEKGWYNTDKEDADLRKNAFLRTGSHKMWGEHIRYEKLKGISEAFTDIILQDTTEQVFITGDYGWRSTIADSAFVTGRAQMLQVMGDDTLFMHADTLYAIRDSVSRAQKLSGDSAKKVMLAYHNVKIFKSDLQGKCDSLAYVLRDSIVHLFKAPVLWSNTNQLTATKISMQLANNRIDRMLLRSNAFIISREDTLRYNQIKGKDMVGYFEDNELRTIYVEGNGQTIYYARDKQNKFIGVNKADGTDINIKIVESKVWSLSLIKDTNATFHPMKDLSPKDLMLKDFLWRGGERPKSREEIFY